MRPPTLARIRKPDETDESRFIIGMDDLTLDGQPFPWPTVGDWTVTISDEGIATLNVQIAVTLPPDEGS